MFLANFILSFSDKSSRSKLCVSSCISLEPSMLLWFIFTFAIFYPFFAFRKFCYLCQNLTKIIPLNLWLKFKVLNECLNLLSNAQKLGFNSLTKHKAKFKALFALCL